MLKYYSYYNVGGYKDMFLGDSSMKATETHYLPLLSIWKKKAAAGDSEADAKIKRTKNLSKIQILSNNRPYLFVVFFPNYRYNTIAIRE